MTTRAFDAAGRRKGALRGHGRSWQQRRAGVLDAFVHPCAWRSIAGASPQSREPGRVVVEAGDTRNDPAEQGVGGANADFIHTLAELHVYNSRQPGCCLPGPVQVRGNDLQNTWRLN